MSQLYTPIQEVYDRIADEQEAPRLQLFDIANFIEGLVRQSFSLVVMELCAAHQGRGFPGFTRYEGLYRGATTNRILQHSQQLLIDLGSPEIERLQAISAKRFSKSLDTDDLADCHKFLSIRNDVFHGHGSRDVGRNELLFSRDLARRLATKNRVLSNSLRLEPTGEPFLRATDCDYELRRVELAYGNHNGRPLSSGVFHIESSPGTCVAVLNALKRYSSESGQMTFDSIGRHRGIHRTRCRIENPSHVFSDLPREWLPSPTRQKGHRECEMRLLQEHPLELDQELDERFMGRDGARRFISDFLLASPSGILLIEADLGTGKSWLLRRAFLESQSITEKYAISACCVYFYSRKTEGQTASATEMLKHLFAQIIVQLDLSDSMIVESNYIILAKRVIEELRARSGANPPMIMLFVDALDEIISERERLSFAGMLRRISSDAAGLLKVVVSCRCGTTPADELQPDVLLPEHLLEDREEIEQYAQTMLSTEQSLSADDVNSLSIAIADKVVTNYLYAHHLVRLVQEGAITTVEQVECLPTELFKFFKVDLEKKVAAPSGDVHLDVARVDILPVLSILRLFKKLLPIKYIAEFTGGSAAELANNVIPLLAEYLAVHKAHIDSPHIKGNRIDGSVPVEASIGLRVTGHLEFLEGYEPINNIIGELTAEVVRYTASSTDPLSIELLARSWRDVYEQLPDDSALLSLSKNRAFVDTYIDLFGLESDGFEHPVYRWAVKDKNYGRMEDYVQAVVRDLIYRQENQVLDHLTEERYWSAWFSGRPLSLRGLSNILSHVWPFYLFDGAFDPDLCLGGFNTQVLRQILPLSTFDFDAGNRIAPHGWKNYQVDRWGLLRALRIMVILHGTSDDMRSYIDFARATVFHNLEARTQDLHWAASWLNNWWLNMLSFLGRVETLRGRNPSSLLASELTKLLDWWTGSRYPVHTLAISIYSPQLQSVMSYLDAKDRLKVEGRLIAVWRNLGECLSDYYDEQVDIFVKKYPSDGVVDSLLDELESCFEEFGHEEHEQTVKDLSERIGNGEVGGSLDDLLNQLPEDRHKFRVPWAIYMSGFAFNIDEIAIPAYLDQRDGTTYFDEYGDCEFVDFKEFPWMIPLRVMEAIRSSDSSAVLGKLMYQVLGSVKVRARATLVRLLAFRIAFSSFDTYWNYIQNVGEFERRYLFESGFGADRETIWGLSRGTLQSSLHEEPENIDALCRIMTRSNESDPEDDSIENLVRAGYSGPRDDSQGASTPDYALDANQQFLAVNTILENYCVSNDQLGVLLQCYGLTADRFRRVSIVHLDPQSEADISCYWTYFIGFLKRNIWDNEGEPQISSALAPCDEQFIKKKSSEPCLWLDKVEDREWSTHSPFAHIDMTFGWLFLMKHSAKKVPDALLIIREGIDESAKWSATGLEFLDSFVVALGLLGHSLSRHFAELYSEMFPEFVVDTNIPDCIESYNYIYELDSGELVKFLDDHYASSQGAVTGGDLLRDLEITKKALESLCERKTTEDITVQELLDSVEEQLT